MILQSASIAYGVCWWPRCFL